MYITYLVEREGVNLLFLSFCKCSRFSTHNGGFISNSILSNTCATYSAAAAKPAWSLSSQSSESYYSSAFFMISSALRFVFFWIFRLCYLFWCSQFKASHCMHITNSVSYNWLQLCNSDNLDATLAYFK